VTGPVVSVVVPTRNRRRQLELALRSVLWQEDADLEVVVVDDGSTDDTASFVAGIQDQRVRLIGNDPQIGVSAARNRGVAEARGDWIAFLDDDDLWAPTKLRLQLATLRTTGSQWAYGGEVIVDQDLRVLDGSPPPRPQQVTEWLEHYDAVPGGTSSVVVSRELLAQVGGFDPRLSASEDWDLWIRLGRRDLPACVATPIVAVSVDHAATLRKMPRLFEELHQIAGRHGIAVDWARHYRWAAWQAVRVHRRWEATRYYGAAVAAGDWRSLGRAAVALLTSADQINRSGRTAEAKVWMAEAERWIQALRQRESTA
jgi:glycosyltransferase involved in cell wall biosynthesis